MTGGLGGTSVRRIPALGMRWSPRLAAGADRFRATFLAMSCSANFTFCHRVRWRPTSGASGGAYDCPPFFGSRAYRFSRYARDRGEPERVHVEREDGIAKYGLDPIRVHSNGGLSRIELARVEKVVESHRSEWVEACKSIAATESEIPLARCVQVSHDSSPVDLAEKGGRAPFRSQGTRACRTTVAERKRWRLIAMVRHPPASDRRRCQRRRPVGWKSLWRESSLVQEMLGLTRLADQPHRTGGQAAVSRNALGRVPYDRSLIP